MSTILELILNKNLEVQDGTIFYKNSNNITDYQFDVLNLLFNNFEKCYVDEIKMVWKQVEFVRKIEYKTDENYIQLFDDLKEESELNNKAPERVYIEKISNFTNKSIKLKDIKDLYINNISLRNLCQEGIFKKNLKTLTHKELLQLKNYQNGL